MPTEAQTLNGKFSRALLFVVIYAALHVAAFTGVWWFWKWLLGLFNVQVPAWIYWQLAGIVLMTFLVADDAIRQRRRRSKTVIL